jgi:DNA replication licensing factor MCM4
MHFAKPPVKASAKIPTKDMREFIAYARQECFPKLTDEAAQKLVQGYIDLRRQGAATGSQK